MFKIEDSTQYYNGRRRNVKTEDSTEINTNVPPSSINQPVTTLETIIACGAIVFTCNTLFKLNVIIIRLLFKSKHGYTV